jgi:DNA-binding MarR family transcriptional regulator
MGCFSMTAKGQRKGNGSFELAGTPAHLLRRCYQFHGDLFQREAGARDLTKQQFTLLCALEHNDGISQTELVDITGIDRSTLAEMVRRMRERGLLSRDRTEEDMRANAVAITVVGRKALKLARSAAEKADKGFLDPLPAAERTRFLRLLGIIAAAADSLNGNGSHGGRHKPRKRT